MRCAPRDLWHSQNVMVKNGNIVLAIIFLLEIVSVIVSWRCSFHYFYTQLRQFIPFKCVNEWKIDVQNTPRPWTLSALSQPVSWLLTMSQCLKNACDGVKLFYAALRKCSFEQLGWRDSRNVQFHPKDRWFSKMIVVPTCQMSSVGKWA